MLSKMSASIRPAILEDIPVILLLIKELAEYEKLAHEVVATETGLKNHLFCESPRVRVLIAEVAGQVSGFALYFYSFSTFLGKQGIYLEDLYVRPKSRGLGVGKLLLQSLAQIAVQEGCGRLEWSVLDWNTPAIEFYHRLGASAQSEWTTYRVTGDSLSELAHNEPP